MASFTKIFNPCKISRGRVNRNVYVTVSYEDGRLSLSGVAGPRVGGGCVMAGQIQEALSEGIPNKGWDIDSVNCLQYIWKRWHLNDMRAGSPKQEEYLRELERRGESLDYAKACEALKDAGIYEDEDCIHEGRPYRYGSGWLKEEIPAWVLDWLKKRPETKKKPAWTC